MWHDPKEGYSPEHEPWKKTLAERASAAKSACIRFASRAARQRGPRLTGFQTGSGQTRFSQKDHKSPTCCHVVCFKRTLVATFCSHFPVKARQGESRHFCDDPVCPDPVWKLPIGGEVRPHPPLLDEPAPPLEPWQTLGAPGRWTKRDGEAFRSPDPGRHLPSRQSRPRAHNDIMHILALRLSSLL